MNTPHMVDSADYGFTPVGGRVCKETDGGVPRAAAEPGIEALGSCVTGKVRCSCSPSLTFTTKGYVTTAQHNTTRLGRNTKSTASQHLREFVGVSSWSVRNPCFFFMCVSDYFCLCVKIGINLASD